ncbi:MAG: hypothetical protein Athens071416_42 [Parcubacteria group bacterium Athens0714_16]|nr:MAG: hypothetical protein Athens071416_42 [Parcubacteria group bacterium Athens0714_16]
MSKDKTVIQLVDELYRNFNYTVGQCITDMLSNSKITLDDLKKDRSLKKLDWMSVEQQTDSWEVKEIAKMKIEGKKAVPI